MCKESFLISGKMERRQALSALKEKAKEKLVPEDATSEFKEKFTYFFEELQYKTMRRMIIDENRRIDGRNTKEIRPITAETHVLKAPHGSALFTRGETQSIGVVTLAAPDEGQIQESLLNPMEERRFMLHYNMPGYSVGEPKRMGGVGRREVGHGNLAERALQAIVPPKEKFPYVVRVVSEITESNGSSSMASVCSGCLAMLDAGIPIIDMVAGIAMGLIKEGNEFAVLSDILGDEDHLGDMDFKVTGNENGITALQMDIKIQGLSYEILKTALAQAYEGRMHILGIMRSSVGKPRDISERAPRIERMRIRTDRIRDLIGPGGKNIKGVTAHSGCKVTVDDEGVVTITSPNGQKANMARRLITQITSDPEIGEIYLGIVKKVTDFGAFVEIKPGVEGLIHISHIAADRVEKVEDIIKEGEEVLVKVIELDRTGRIKLSRKDALGKSPTVEPLW